MNSCTQAHETLLQAVFDFFSLGHNKGYDEQAFLWSDMLHYRKTGAFGQALWNGAVASGDDGAKAYALGYLTHMATDVTGHALAHTTPSRPLTLHTGRVTPHIPRVTPLHGRFNPHNLRLTPHSPRLTSHNPRLILPNGRLILHSLRLTPHNLREFTRPTRWSITPTPV